ncbi:BrnA antitoxin family protein [Aurantimonas sp. A3-2-R12]|uniref:BrnA antitoxin family protein n=1 Tax=Aurantimonas sp. A3-2-R12 TaxID=3114362 RepID=UPI002E18D7CC|nr:BrnA antitoxin family protein [Aurantimonas sp. A3-2-R12]
MREAGELHHNPNAPVGESLGREFWAKAMVSSPQGTPPKSVHLKLDPEVFDFYKSKGKGHLTKMQEVLRAYAVAHQ